jgi:hypothetical protein
MAIDGARIQRVTKEGLFYLDDEGKEVFIDFQACYERKLAQFMQPENLKRFKAMNPHMDNEQYIEALKRSRYVADRNSLSAPWGDGPYIEFYTDPPTRFVFDPEIGSDIAMRIEFLAPLPPNGASKEELEAFFASQTGWKTFDLS